MKTQLILGELNALFAALPCDCTEALACRLLRAPRVFVSGAGRSGLALKMLAMRLVQLGKTAFAAGESVTPAMEPGDLLLVASASGRTAGVCRHAQIAAGIGAQVFVITADGDAPLAGNYPSLVLPCRHKDAPADGGAQPMGSLFEQALLIFLDGCVLSCMEMTGENGRSMRARHANLE